MVELTSEYLQHVYVLSLYLYFEAELRQIGSLGEATQPFSFCLHSEMESTHKGKNLLP